ncbi:MAG: NosD domain-containing protein [Candidatus Bathyarchaeia archaeon]|jgi:parallel beta-helix repeat protein
MNRVVLVLVAILFLLSVSSITGLIQVAKADGATITINADGSISPSTAPIYTADNITYTLTRNITSSSDGIDVERDSIILDGAGFTVQGEGTGNGIDLSNTSSVTIENTNVANFNLYELDYGIYLENSSNASINGNNITNNYEGIYLDSSSNASVTGNNITADTYGIGLDSSSNNNISGNNITNNGQGIGLYSCSNNSVSENNITNNYSPTLPAEGVYLFSSSDNTISQNNITTNYFGLGVQFGASSNNTVSENIIANNIVGIVLRSSTPLFNAPIYYSSDNIIYHNSFINNAIQASGGWRNVWDNGYPSGGNYWSDYLTKYPNATQLDSSGVWDQPYVIDTNNTDYYPLLIPIVVVPPAHGGGTVTINADGSISPSTAPIYTADNITYTLTGNIIITSDTNGIVIERDNIVLNGAGYAVTGSGSGNGTTLANVSNVEVRNMTITNFATGIWLNSSSNNTLSGNHVTNNVIGIFLWEFSNNNTLSGNNVVNDDYGVWLYSSSNCTLSGNTVTANNVESIYLYSSSDCTLSSNTVANNDFGIYLYSSSNCTLSGNTVTANPFVSIYIDSSFNCTLSYNNVTDNKYGIWLDSSDNNTLSGNNLTANSYYGISLYSSSSNTISGNSVTANNYNGISFESSSNNTIYHNDFINNASQVSSYNSTNFWNNGSVGNYWSDYLMKYPNATQVESSGVWNTPYVIDANNTDYYPLTVPIAIVPEFPSYLVLSLFMVATLVAVIVCKKVRKQGKCW